MGDGPPGQHRPRKRFGQHFLEPPWVSKVLRAIDPQAGDTFIEIGPGRGAITFPLATRAQSVLAFEIDRDLAAALRATAPANVTVVEGDFLEVSTVDVAQAAGRASPSRAANAIRAAGNLPYNVASPILFRLAALHAGGTALVDATVMLQREVADRLAAPPGSRDYGVLSVLIGHRALVKRLLTLPPGAFRPAPRVHSAVVNLRFHDPEPSVLDEKVFAGVVHAVFTRRRKTLANALLAYRGTDQARTHVPRSSVPLPSPAEALRAAGLDGSRRPETLGIAEFVRLADAYSSDSR
jgi:16S rRNA (adenine1518-N6/adenine1519-N6)-dimethyltransferase